MNHRQKLVQQQFLNNEKEILNRLKRVYGQAQLDINAKIKTLELDIDGLESLWDDFEGTKEEADILKSRIQSKIYQKKYQEAIKGQIDGILGDLRRNAYENINEYLEKCYDDGFIGTMFDLQGQGIPMIMPIDQEATVRAVQLESKISKGLYTRMGEEVETLKTNIAKEVSRGIANGFSYAQVAQQIKFKMTGTYTTPGGAMYRAQTIARTEGHRIQTTAAMDACYKAKEKGADVVKQWDATLDAKTRNSHVAVDGEIRELDKPFSNGLMFPGDPAGGAAEVVNCRCALLQRAKWALEGGFTKYDNFSGEIKEFESLEAYNEFKKAYFSKENRAYMNYVGELENRYGTKDFNKILDLMDDDEYARFVKLQDARPVFPGVHRGDDVIKAGDFKAHDGFKKTLANLGNSGIIKLDIDELTPCLRRLKDGKIVQTEVLEIKPKKGDFKDWEFDWTLPAKSGHSVFAIKANEDQRIQGLVALKRDARNIAVHVDIVEAAPFNNPHNKAYKGKEYSGVGGHLFAEAVRQSYDAGFGGAVYFTAKSDLVEHYKKELGAILTNPRQRIMFIDEEAAKKLYNRYYGGE